MANAIRVHSPGGPENMVYEPYETGQPDKGEVRLSHSAVGLNFIDVYHRTGLYPIEASPFVPGLSLIHISGPRDLSTSRMPSSA